MILSFEMPVIGTGQRTSSFGVTGLVRAQAAADWICLFRLRRNNQHAIVCYLPADHEQQHHQARGPALLYREAERRQHPIQNVGCEPARNLVGHVGRSHDAMHRHGSYDLEHGLVR